VKTAFLLVSFLFASQAWAYDVTGVWRLAEHRCLKSGAAQNELPNLSMYIKKDGTFLMKVKGQSVSEPGTSNPPTPSVTTITGKWELEADVLVMFFTYHDQDGKEIPNTDGPEFMSVYHHSSTIMYLTGEVEYMEGSNCPVGDRYEGKFERF
jgi:hypothetical protein